MLSGTLANDLMSFSSSESATVRSGALPGRSLPTRMKNRSDGTSPVRSLKLGNRMTGISALCALPPVSR
ncbi:MAG: hypothetical protein R3F14_08285 [Polyangiaceae bacterium]